MYNNGDEDRQTGYNKAFTEHNYCQLQQEKYLSIQDCHDKFEQIRRIVSSWCVQEKEKDA